MTTQTEIAEAWQRWDAHQPMTPEQVRLLSQDPGSGARMESVETRPVPTRKQAPAKAKPLRTAFAKAALKGKSDEALMRPLSTRATYDLVGDAIDGVVETLAEAFQDLHKRLDELEKTGTRFRGVYQRASTYRRGDQATHKGSLWTALKDAPEGTVPGESPAHWQLAAKGTG